MTNSRIKGQKAELELAKILSEVYPGAKRGVGERHGRFSMPDIIGTPFWLEVKRYKSIPDINKIILQVFIQHSRGSLERYI